MYLPTEESFPRSELFVVELVQQLGICLSVIYNHVAPEAESCWKVVFGVMFAEKQLLGITDK